MINLKSERIKNIAFLQLSFFVFSLGGIAAKKASTFSFASIEFLVYYSVELIIIGVYAIMWQQIIKKFELSIAYANKGILIIWTFIWAVLFFKETITVNNILGAILVIAGIVMVFKDAK